MVTSLALSQPVSPSPHHVDQQGKFVAILLMDAEGAAQRIFKILSATNHDKLPRPSLGGYLWRLQPDKVNLWHKLSICRNGSNLLSQAVSFLR